MTRWLPPVRGITWLAVIGAVLAATGVAVGARAAIGSAAGPQTVRDSLAYTCTFPSGQQRVSVMVAATFPAAGTAGRPIQPSGTQVTVTLPHPAVADLTALHAATVSAIASLTVEVSQASRSGATTWAGLTAPGTPVPAKGALPLTAPDTAGPVTIATPGDVTFSAAGLSLVLRPQQANGTATRPAVMRVPCTLSPGQDAALATMPVTGATGTQASGQAAGSLPRAALSTGTKYCPPLAKALKLNPRFPPPPFPPGSIILHSPGVPPYCAYAEGFSDVRKLNGAAFLGPGLTNISAFLNSAYDYSPKINYFQQDSAGEFSYHGMRQFPPAKATFLGFGFMPTSAVMQLSEIGTINIVTVGPATACPPICPALPTITTVSSRVVLRIYDVTVNGAPLNVSPHCQTAPFDVVLYGRSDSSPPYQFSTGGPLTGTVTIPSFTGCGVGENLDPLFTGAVSGPGNYIKLTQGAVCEQPSGLFCPPKKPKPIR
jgi:hypothetical protein